VNARTATLRHLPGLLRLLLLSIALPAALASAASASRPNLLLIVFDDWGGSTHAGIAGSTWVRTPHFDRIAREGVWFRNAFTANPKCSPSRAMLLTGRNTWQLREAVSHGGYFPAGFQVYPDLLERAGYTVGLTGKGWSPGDFRTLARRERNPAGPSFDDKTLSPPASGMSSNDYAGNFAAFLQQRPPDRPFCFWMGFSEPHRPYEAGAGVRQGARLEDVRVPAYLPDLPAVRSDLLDYAAEIAWGDSHVGRALAALEAAGELERTLVVVTSDHGMPFPYVKGQITEDAIHVPLAMRWGEGIAPGRVVDDFVSLRDFAPTFLELAGLAPHPQMTGRSLVSLLRSPRSGWLEHRDEMLAGKERHDIGRPQDAGYPVRALRTREFLYIRNLQPERWPAGNPETDFTTVAAGPTKEVLRRLGGHYYDLSLGRRPPRELYRLSDDPECVRNLAHEPAFSAEVASLEARLWALLRAEGDPRAHGEGTVLEAYEYRGSRRKAYETWLRPPAPD